MSYPTKISKIEQSSSVNSFLVRINQFKEVVVERLPQDAAIVSSSRGMCVLGVLGNWNFICNVNDMLETENDPDMPVLVPRCCYADFRCDTYEELVAKLNSKTGNHVQVMWDFCPTELKPLAIQYDTEKDCYVVVPTPEPEQPSAS